MRRYLVVANQTLSAQDVLGKIGSCLTSGPCRIHFLVPATPPDEGLTYTAAEAASQAQERLDKALHYFRERGYDVSGEVGDPNPVDAVHDAIHREPFDEIILSTFPAGASRWLRMDLPSRLERQFGLPVSHFESQLPNAPEIPAGAQGFRTP